MYDMSTLTLRIPDSLDAELARQCEELGVSKSDFAREALRRHLATREFRSLRGVMVPHAMAQGVFTDDDVFLRIGKR